MLLVLMFCDSLGHIVLDVRRLPKIVVVGDYMTITIIITKDYVIESQICCSDFMYKKDRNITTELTKQ